jgi:trehalose-6-phosphate synthase
VEFSEKPKKPSDMIHYFETNLTALKSVLPALKNQITRSGSIWVSWPKKSSKIETDVSENLIREIGLACGLVDIKVCAVDEVWSGLKFVIPVKDRYS